MKLDSVNLTLGGAAAAAQGEEGRETQQADGGGFRNHHEVYLTSDTGIHRKGIASGERWGGSEVQRVIGEAAAVVDQAPSVTQAGAEEGALTQ
jgi:hypothetical protein